MQKVEGSSPFIRFVIGSVFAGRFVKARPLVSCAAHDGFAHELEPFRGGHETGASFRSGALIALGLSPRP